MVLPDVSFGIKSDAWKECGNLCLASLDAKCGGLLGHEALKLLFYQVTAPGDALAAILFPVTIQGVAVDSENPLWLVTIGI